MKLVKNYHDELIMAYQDADLDKLATVLAHAAMLWHAEWKKQGGEDKGTCCGGKGQPLSSSERGSGPRVPQGAGHRECHVQRWLDRLKREGTSAISPRESRTGEPRPVRRLVAGYRHGHQKG